MVAATDYHETGLQPSNTLLPLFCFDEIQGFWYLEYNFLLIDSNR